MIKDAGYENMEKELMKKVYDARIIISSKIHLGEFDELLLSLNWIEKIIKINKSLPNDKASEKIKIASICFAWTGLFGPDAMVKIGEDIVDSIKGVVTS